MRKLLLLVIAVVFTAQAYAWNCNMNRESSFDKSTVDTCYNAFLNHQLEAIQFKISQEFGLNLSVHGRSKVGSDSEIRSEFHDLLDEALRLEQLKQFNQPCPVCETCSSNDDDE